jgi:hypothetical protein
MSVRSIAHKSIGRVQVYACSLGGAWISERVPQVVLQRIQAVSASTSDRLEIGPLIMSVTIKVVPIYCRWRFEAEVIELCLRGYITYRPSYRGLVTMMAERRLTVSHTMIVRWVVRMCQSSRAVESVSTSGEFA